METIKTSDLFLSALFLTQNIPILEVSREKYSKSKIIFAFPETEKSAVLKEQFKHGIAQANVLSLKHSYIHIQELFYEAKRKYDLF